VGLEPLYYTEYVPTAEVLVVDIVKDLVVESKVKTVLGVATYVG